MNIDQYIHQFMLDHQSNDEMSSLEKKQQWIVKNPTIVKIAEFAGMFFGAASIILLPYSFPALGFGAILLAAAGGIVALVSYAAYKVLDIIAPPHHSMQNHVFKEGTYGVGRVYYQGDVPILELNSDDPYQAGYAHGYLMGEPLNQLLDRMEFVIKWTGMLPKSHDVPETLKAISQKIPAEYMDELQGVVDGFNQWSKENKWFGARTVTVEDLLLFHLIPDSLHFSPNRVEHLIQNELVDELEENPSLNNPLSALGCTVVIDQDDEEGITFGRNMDWPSFGLFGTFSLAILRKYSNGKLSTVGIGLPSFCGEGTGMNKEGVSLAMNVCAGNTNSVSGIPALFFNRLALEKCHNLDEVEQLINQEDPLGCYHLSAADENSAKSFHFYQGVDNSHTIREWQAGEPLITTNCNYPTDQEENKHMHCSLERKNIIDEFFEEAAEKLSTDELEKAKLVEASLALPFVNNSITTHKVVMYPQSRKMKVALDNAFAGEIDLHDLNAGLLLD